MTLIGVRPHFGCFWLIETVRITLKNNKNKKQPRINARLLIPVVKTAISDRSFIIAKTAISDRSFIIIAKTAIIDRSFIIICAHTRFIGSLYAQL